MERLGGKERLGAGAKKARAVIARPAKPEERPDYKPSFLSKLGKKLSGRGKKKR